MARCGVFDGIVVGVEMKMSEWYGKMGFGFLLLLAILVLAVIVARQSAEQEKIDNADLQQILTIFSVLAGGFAAWAFANKNGPDGPS